MSGFKPLFRLISVSLVILARLSFIHAAPSSDTNLIGTVKSADGKPLEGIAISAQADGKTFKTTVYSDRAGGYFFPPLADGQYKVWAQAVGFEADRAELKLSTSKKTERTFVLKTLQDFSKQLSGTEWIASLPGESYEDRRMKAIFRHVCAGCHVPNFVLQNRFDAAGWSKIVDFMEKINIFVRVAEEARGPSNQLVHAYKEELVNYLARVRGPNSPRLNYKPLPRPTGEAARIVVTEYDIPSSDKPGYISSYNGSDWSEGTPSHHEGRAAHDVAVDQEGNVWFGDTVSFERTIGKLDPQSGRITNYKLPDDNNVAVSAHGIVVDQKGDVWFTNNTEGILAKFDPKTGRFQRFPRPSSLPTGSGGTMAVDSKGNLWVTQMDRIEGYGVSGGVYKLDPRTGEYIEYKALSKGGGPYGITVDAKDNVWFAQMSIDRVGLVESRTGKVSDVILDPVEVSAKDREIGTRFAVTWGNVGALYQKGPRRLRADRRGNSIWVAQSWEAGLAKIDINTRKVTEYPVPHLGSTPYDTEVDKNHMVWIALMNSDRIAKFDPFTEQFTEYPLPTLGTEARHIAVDNRTDPPTVWVPYYRVNKIARIQFRNDSSAHVAVSSHCCPGDEFQTTHNIV